MRSAISKISRLVVAAPLLSIGCGNTTPSSAPEESVTRSMSEALSTGFYYLRCNATSWNVDETSRMTGSGSLLSLTIHVAQTWMVTNGDSCQLTLTNQLDGWGTSNTAFGLSGASRIVVPGAAPVTPTQTQFIVKYPQTGTFTATLDLIKNTLTIGSPVSPHSWVNLDSSVVSDSGQMHPLGGRVDYIRVDPRSANVVYAGTYGGGIWKSTDFTLGQHWLPTTEGVSSLAVGGMDLDPSAPDTLYVGLGDPWGDVLVGAVIKTTNGGAQWSAPVALSGTYPPAAGGTFVKAGSVRDLAVDPNNHNVLVTTNVGLFVSTDRGQSFRLVDLPNVAAQAIDDVWSIAYVGAAAGVSTWVVSGESVDGGDLWRSSDGGSTWRSGRASNAFPISPDGIHRMAVAAGVGSSPTTTAVFVEADAGNGHTWLFRSTDGGQTYAAISGSVASSFSTDCPTTDSILGGQGWFNRAIAVDPTNSNHVIFGGQLCSVRTLDALDASPVFGQSSWSGGTPASPWPFAHADWHGALVSTVGGVVRTFAGNDGGLFSSTNLWTTPAGSEAQIRWTDHNTGIRSQIADWVGTGDSSRGLDGIFMAGLADQGSIMGVKTGSSWAFSIIGGGDGEEPAVDAFAGSEFINFWDNADRFCSGSLATCSDQVNYTTASFTFPPGEGDHAPWFVPQLTDITGSTFLAATKTILWSVTSPGPGGTTLTWTQVGSSSGHTIQAVTASPTTAGLYGAAAAGGFALVVLNGSQSLSNPIPTGADLASISFPGQTPAGHTPGDTFVVAVNGQDPVPHMYMTTNRGLSWTALGTQGLPNVGVHVVRFDPSDKTNQILYAGTYAGAFVSGDGGSTWSRAGVGLPNVRVHDLIVSLDGALVRIATKGRGLWELATK